MPQEMTVIPLNNGKRPIIVAISAFYYIVSTRYCTVLMMPDSTFMRADIKHKRDGHTQQCSEN